MEIKEDQARPGVTIAMSCAAMAIGGGLGWTLLPPLMPMIAAELSISQTMGGIIWGAMALGFAVASPFGGVAVDRYGPRRMGAVAIFLGALASAARGLVHDPWTLSFCMFLFGLSAGLQTPTVPKALGSHVRPNRLGQANGITLLSLMASQAVIYLIAHTVLAPMFGGWRPLQFMAGAAMAIIGVLWVILVRDRLTGSGVAGIVKVMRLARGRQVLLLTVVMLLQSGGYVVMLGMLPRALSEGGLSPEKVGLALSLWLVINAMASFLGPWLSDRTGYRRPFIIFGSILAGGALMALAFLPAEASAWLLCAAAIGSGSFGPLLFAIPVELPSIGPINAGAALGFMCMVSQIVASVFSVITGVAADIGGLAAAMAVLALIHFAILLPTRGLMETGPKAVASGSADSSLAESLIACEREI